MEKTEPEIESKAYSWLEDPYDAETQKRVKNLLDHDTKTLTDSFYKDLEFGTGGMRGVMGVGTNRINQYTIQAATQGLANYLKKIAPDTSHKVVICYDCRNGSRFLAQETAKVLLGNEIQVFMPKELRPTPFASFLCRHLGCSAAIMITASHNPPEYNGYKVYWSDGAQIVPPHDQGIIEEVNLIQDPRQVLKAPLTTSLFHELELDTAYLDAIEALQILPEQNKQAGSELKIIYSPLHGAGITLIPEALRRWGFTSLSLVEKQKTPDGNFTHAPSPNPEEKQALELGSKQLLSEKGDIFIATDPDADRLGVVVMHKGKAIPLTGNEFATLCVDYLCKQGNLPENGAFVTTIVSTEILKAISAGSEKPCYEVLTGFKYIGEKMREWEENQKHTFIFGAEESYGYLLGTHVRDKDAIVCACLISEIALNAKKQDKTLIDVLYEIYKTFGIYREKLLSIKFKEEKETPEKIKALMENLRNYPPKEILGIEVSEIEDYAKGIKTHLHNKQKEPLSLPKSNVLSFRLSDRSKFVIRPSGTEPKIKVYGMVQENTSGSIEEGIAYCDKRLEKLLNTIQTKYLTI